MSDDGIIDASDSAAQLPPLDHVDPARILVALAWDASQEGIVAFAVLDEDGVPSGALAGPTPSVVYLSIRGWRPADDPDAPAVWDQLHVGIPRPLLGPIAEALTLHAAQGGH